MKFRSEHKHRRSSFHDLDLVATRVNGERLGGKVSDTKGGREDEDEEMGAWRVKSSGWARYGLTRQVAGRQVSRGSVNSDTYALTRAA